MNTKIIILCGGQFLQFDISSEEIRQEWEAALTKAVNEPGANVRFGKTFIRGTAIAGWYYSEAGTLMDRAVASMEKALAQGTEGDEWKDR